MAVPKQQLDAALASLGSFKRTVYRHTSDYTVTSGTLADIDATNLPALTLTLAIGDVVRTSFHAAFGISNSGNVIKVDWLIDRPTSADTTFRALNGGAAAGVIELGGAATDSNSRTIIGLFTCTEAGVHSFKPQWAVSATTGILVNIGAYGCAMINMVENLGPAAA